MTLRILVLLIFYFALPSNVLAQCKSVEMKRSASPYSSKVGVIFVRSCNGGRAFIHIALIDDGEVIPDVANVAIIDSEVNVSLIDWEVYEGMETFLIQTEKGWRYTLQRKQVGSIQVWYST
jgi:hypothetical protein